MFFSCLLVFFVVVNVSSAGKIILFVFIAYQKAFDLIDLACNYVNYTSSIIMVSKKGARSISKLALRPYTNLAISRLPVPYNVLRRFYFYIFQVRQVFISSSYL